jgi:SpoVK/Ycf46/Vps4 family AAA+-type ATPase
LLKNPFDQLQRMAYAEALLEHDRVADALSQFELINKQDPSHDRALHQRVHCLLELGRMSEAEPLFRQWRERVGPTELSELDSVFSRGQAAGVVSPLRLHRGEGPADESAGHGTGVSFADIVGMDELKEQLRIKVLAPFANPGLFAKFKKSAGGGVLLFGPPGCGKTMVAKALATECRAHFISVGISDILSHWQGESESNLAKYFVTARERRPSVLFFDEVDALGHSRAKSQAAWISQLVAEFLAQLDGFGRDNTGVLLLAATNMPWDVDQAMLRPGRFSRQVFVPPPDRPARAEMFRLKLNGVPNDVSEFDRLAEATPLFSGADIDGVIDQAKELVLGEILKGGSERAISANDLLKAISKSAPTTKDWLNTAKNMVKYGGGEGAYQDVAEFLKKNRMI